MSPLGVVAVAGALATSVAFVRRPSRSTRVVAQTLLSLSAWGLLWFATSSAFAQRGMENLPDHMIGHVIVMFVVPMALIGASTMRSLAWCLPASWRRVVQRRYYGRSWRMPSWLAHPIVAAFVLNLVMVGAHLPRLFNATMAHRWMMDWLMEPAFLLSGLFFFHFIIPAWPRRPQGRLRLQFFMVAVTMLEMLIMAMAMSLFTKSAWYIMAPASAMVGMPGMATTPAASFSQQQLAAAILWICGDFWAVPCLILIVRRVMQRDGSLLATLDRQSSRFSSETG